MGGCQIRRSAGLNMFAQVRGIEAAKKFRVNPSIPEIHNKPLNPKPYILNPETRKKEEACDTCITSARGSDI